jgi:hypothetical protein
VQQFRPLIQQSAPQLATSLSVPEQIPVCRVVKPATTPSKETHMGRSILLWLLGVPIPIIILIALLYH